MNRIKIQIGYGLRILFVGINPHPGSFQRGVPFSNNKMFWYLLHDAGLITPSRELLRDDSFLKNVYMHEFKKVYRFGLINMIDVPTRSTVKLKLSQAEAGRKRLLAVIKRYKPRTVCFVSKVAYRMFSGKKHVTYGWKPDIDASKIFVMHSPHHGFARIRVKELKEVLAASS